MLSWRFLQNSDGSGVNADLLSQYQMQVISDVYRAMQTRLDGYRQSAGAIFLAVVAAMLTLDATTVSTIIKAVLEPAKNYSIDRRMGVFALIVGCFVLILSAAGAFVIHRLGAYYAEMTSIVYKIDQNNEVFDHDVYLPGVALFPRMFRVIGENKNVSRDDEPNVPGWHDPSIKRFWILTLFFGVLHCVVGVLACRLIVYGSIGYWPIW